MLRTKSTRIFFALTLLTVIGAFPALGQTNAGNDSERVTVHTELVNINVLARQKATGRIIGNLDKGDFSVARKTWVVA